MKILHIMILDDKFIPPFIKFINENFNPNDHVFAITDKPRSNYDMDLNFNNVFLLDEELKIVEFERYLYKAKKDYTSWVMGRKDFRIIVASAMVIEKSLVGYVRWRFLSS